jgi:Rieske Fe-S protein
MYNSSSPVGAQQTPGSFGRVVCKGATNSQHEFVSPFQGFDYLGTSQPRPLAGADLRDAFGVELHASGSDPDTRLVQPCSRQIHRNPPNRNKSNTISSTRPIATGDSGMGMTHGTIAGMLIRDLILGENNSWASLYDPARKPLKTLGKYVKENLNVARQYGRWATPGEIESVDDLEPGEGAILRRGLEKIAVYRDESGRLHQMSAVCPHLQCIVAWNSAKRMWDCPCHGSLFDPYGKVVNGPANTHLQELSG